jgi:hypothetical protein
MSRAVLRRLGVIVAAYALVLQPIAAASVALALHSTLVFCSGASGDSAPPAGHRPQDACCLTGCCGVLIRPMPPAVFLVLPQIKTSAAVVHAQVFAPAWERYPRSRAPPMRPALLAQQV